MNEDQVKELLQRYDNIRELMTRMNADMLQIKSAFSKLEKKRNSIESQISKLEKQKGEAEDQSKIVEQYLLRAKEYEKKLEDQEALIFEQRIDTSELEKKLLERQKRANKKLNDQLKNLQTHDELLDSVVMDYITNVDGIYFDEDAVVLDAEGIYITLINVTYYNKKLIVKMAMATEDHDIIQILAMGVRVNDIAIKRSLPLTLLGMSNEMIIYLFIDSATIPFDVVTIEDINSIEFALKVKTEIGEYTGKPVKADTDGHIIKKEEYDPDQLYTISDLTEFNTEEPLIVEKTTWTNDYCFVVKYIEENDAKGKVYKNGKYVKETSYPVDQKVFRIYDGRYRNSIKLLETDYEQPFK